MELFHLLNRGVDKRQIFMNDGDRVRFVHNLYEMNDTRPANNTSWNLSKNGNGANINDLRGRYSERERIVDIHGWCLMKNHYHLLVSERAEGALTKFLMKMNVGYAKYFNEKYKRSGTLFQGRTKKVLIAREAHFLHILHYIHFNPLDYLESAHNWCTGEVRNMKKALAHLEQYRWSSYLDYSGTRNFPSIITRELFDDVFKNYKKVASSFLGDLEVESIAQLPLE